MTEITTKELKKITEDMERICVRMQEINLDCIEKYDKVALMHSIKELAHVMIKQAS